MFMALVVIDLSVDWQPVRSAATMIKTTTAARNLATLLRVGIGSMMIPFRVLVVNEEVPRGTVPGGCSGHREVC